MSSATSKPSTTPSPARNQNAGGQGANSNQKRGQAPKRGGGNGGGKSANAGAQVKDYAAERARRQQADLAKHVEEANRELNDITLAAILALFVAGYPVSEEVLTVSASDASIAAELGVINAAKAAYKAHGRKVTVKPGSFTANRIVTAEPALAETTTENALGLRLTPVGDALARRYIEAMTSKGWRWPAPGHTGPRVSMRSAAKFGDRKPTKATRNSPELQAGTSASA